MTALGTPHLTDQSRPRSALPPLANGDRMTRAEFERRWDAMPELKKAELVDGMVFVTHFVPLSHGEPHAELLGFIGYYHALTRGAQACGPATVRFDDANVFTPDAHLRFRDGQSRVAPDGLLEGAPELVAEVCETATSMDLNDKLHVYRRHGVREYLVWRVFDEAIDWFYLHEGQFLPLPADADGLHKSRVFPGLWLDAPAMLRGDLSAALAAVDRGTAIEEHAAFVQRLATHSDC